MNQTKPLLCCILFACGLVHGVGVFVTPRDASDTTFCGAQVILIQYSDGVEVLTVLTRIHASFYRNAWVIPLPASPVIAHCDTNLMKGFSRLSAPLVHGSETQHYGCFGGSAFKEADYGIDYYEVFSGPLREIDTALTIATSEADSLIRLLERKRYVVPHNAGALFQEYIDKGWTHFVVGEFSTSLDSVFVGITLRFQVDKPVMPTKAASLNAYRTSSYYDSKIPLHLHVVARDKMIFDGANLKSANLITERELAEITRELPDLAGIVSTGDFVTRIEMRYDRAAAISEDIVLRTAADNDEFREIVEAGVYYFYQGNCLLWLLVVLPAYILFRRTKDALTKIWQKRQAGLRGQGRVPPIGQ